MSCSPGMRKCPFTCGHKAKVMDYFADRQAQEISAEDDVTGETRATLTFKDYLTHTKGQGQ